MASIVTNSGSEKKGIAPQTGGHAPSAVQTASRPAQLPAGNPVASYEPQESMPPVGVNNILDFRQLRYCQSEEIRLEGAQQVLNQRSDVDVDRFNGMIDDYNSRCSKYRYRESTLESAKRAAELHREELLADGRGRFPAPTNRSRQTR